MRRAGSAAALGVSLGGSKPAPVASCEMKSILVLACKAGDGRLKEALGLGRRFFHKALFRPRPRGIPRRSPETKAFQALSGADSPGDIAWQPLLTAFLQGHASMPAVHSLKKRRLDIGAGARNHEDPTALVLQHMRPFDTQEEPRKRTPPPAGACHPPPPWPNRGPSPSPCGPGEFSGTRPIGH